MRMRKVKLLAVTFFTFVTLSTVWAAGPTGGISFDRTRAVIEGGKSETAFLFSNETNWAFLVQSKMESAAGDFQKGVMVAPVVIKSLPGQSQRIRIVITDPDQFPQDRETMLWYVGKAIPAKVDLAAAMQINFINRIKVFYRPAGLKGKLVEAMKALKVSREGDKVVLTNNSPFVLSMGSYWVNGKEISTSDVIFPFSTKTPEKITLPAGPVSFGWTAIDEKGALVRTNATVD